MKTTVADRRQITVSSEIEHFIAPARAFAGQQVQLVVTVEMRLEGLTVSLDGCDKAIE